MNHVISFEQKNSKNTCLLKGKLLSLVAAGWTCYGGYVLVLYFLLFPYKQKIKNWVTWQENSVKEHKLGRWFPSAGLWTGVSLQKFPTGPWRSSCCLTHGMPGSYTICYSKYLYINAIIKILICFLCPMEYFYFHLSAGMKGLQLSHQVSLHNLFLSWKIYFLFLMVMVVGTHQMILRAYLVLGFTPGSNQKIICMQGKSIPYPLQPQEYYLLLWNSTQLKLPSPQMMRTQGFIWPYFQA